MDGTGQAILADLPKWNKTTMHPPASGIKTDKTVLTVVDYYCFLDFFWDAFIEVSTNLYIWHHVF